MNRKRLGVILVLGGVVLALGVGVLVYTQAQEAQDIQRLTPTVDVVVAQTDLPDRVAVPEAAVSVIKVPAGMVPVEAAVRLKDVVGKYPMVKIYKSEIVITSKLVDSAAKTVPSFGLKQGDVAFTFAGNDNLLNTGAIRVGDRIDILLTLPLQRVATGGQAVGVSMPMVTQTMLQNVEVIRVGSFPATPGDAGAAAAPSKSITFQVSHQDSLILKWAKDSGGVIDMVLRHPAEKEDVTTDAITGQYVFRKFRFVLSDPIQ